MQTLSSNRMSDLTTVSSRESKF